MVDLYLGYSICRIEINIAYFLFFISFPKNKNKEIQTHEKHVDFELDKEIVNKIQNIIVTMLVTSPCLTNVPWITISSS